MSLTYFVALDVKQLHDASKGILCSSMHNMSVYDGHSFKIWPFTHLTTVGTKSVVKDIFSTLLLMFFVSIV